ncbi:MAG TPA: maleylacetoacetate isomerase, partial [Thermomonas sp.]|nr:maleylacetoacetate isomerase [Thermomonas sp.]
EYLDEVWPTPPLLPATARERQRVRALAQLVACDIHPLNNLRVLQYFEHEWSLPALEREQWVKHWIMDGFAA